MNTTITVNEADILRGRAEFLGSFIGALDAKRPAAWTVYGYPEQVTFPMLLSAYMRGGPAHGAVHRLLDTCWQDNPRVMRPGSDAETSWETQVAKVFDDCGVWEKLQDFDRRNMVGRFSALVYRVADDLTLDQPLARASKLVDMVPLYEDQIKVTSWFSDRLDWENFGKPKMFQMRTMSRAAQVSGDTQAQPEEWLDVHPSRVQILAEGSVGGMFDGVPMLLPGFNALVDLEKITGGSAESYLKNSARTFNVAFAPDAAPQVAAGVSTNEEVAGAIDEQVRRVNRNQDAAFVTQGAEVTVMQTAMHDPTGAWMAAANTFSAAMRIPFTLIFGQQTGRLASDEDKADMQARGKSRRARLLSRMIREFVRRMQACDVLPTGDFKIEWPPLDAPGDKDRVEILKAMTAAMQAAAAAGLTEPLFVGKELRKVQGYDPLAPIDMPPAPPPEPVPVVPPAGGEQ
jgi:hypothetical protein